MPRSRPQFETAPRDYPSPQVGPAATQALVFLAANPELAFRTHEIAAETPISTSRLNAALSQLRQCHLVEYRNGHWAIREEVFSRIVAASPQFHAAPAE